MTEYTCPLCGAIAIHEFIPIDFVDRFSELNDPVGSQASSGDLKELKSLGMVTGQCARCGSIFTQDTNSYIPLDKTAYSRAIIVDVESSCSVPIVQDLIVQQGKDFLDRIESVDDILAFEPREEIRHL